MAGKKKTEEVTASFLKGGLVFEVIRVRDDGTGRTQYTTRAYIWASRSALDKAIRDLGYVKAPE